MRSGRARVRRLGAVLAVALAAVLAVSACDVPAVTAPPSPTAEPPPDSSAVALTGLSGPWRRTALHLPEGLVAPWAAACRAAAEPRDAATIADLPVAVADARGEGAVIVVLADPDAPDPAFECRLTVDPEGAATVDEAPARLDPSALAVGLEEITIVSRTTTDGGQGVRSIVIGRVGRAAGVEVRFEGVVEAEAAMANGWYAAWWPGSDLPAAIQAFDNRHLADYAVADPTLEIEGRVSAATWWVDPAAGPLAADATTVPILLVETACAGAASPEGRVLAPVVESGADAVVVTVWVRRLPGASDCPGNPTHATTIELAEPLGGRALLDGSETPPRDAAVAPAG